MTDGDDGEARSELPPDVVEVVERLTRLARRADDVEESAAYREDRDARLAAFGFTARVREEADRDVLVCHPAEWLVDGTVQLDRIEDRGRAVEVPLGGVGEAGEWAAVEAHNRDLVERVRERYGDPHGANARAFADFAGNHYVRRMETVGERELREFLTEYYPRNAWPTDEQRAAVYESLRLVFAVAGADVPPAVERPSDS